MIHLTYSCNNFEVSEPVNIHIMISWNAALCCIVQGHQIFGVNFCVSLQRTSLYVILYCVTSQKIGSLFHFSHNRHVFLIYHKPFQCFRHANIEILSSLTQNVWHPFPISVGRGDIWRPTFDRQIQRGEYC